MILRTSHKYCSLSSERKSLFNVIEQWVSCIIPDNSDHHCFKTVLSTFFTIQMKQKSRWRVFSSDRLHFAGFCQEKIFYERRQFLKTICEQNWMQNNVNIGGLEDSVRCIGGCLLCLYEFQNDSSYSYQIIQQFFHHKLSTYFLVLVHWFYLLLENINTRSQPIVVYSRCAGPRTSCSPRRCPRSAARSPCWSSASWCCRPRHPTLLPASSWWNINFVEICKMKNVFRLR